MELILHYSISIAAMVGRRSALEEDKDYGPMLDTTMVVVQAPQ